MSEEERRGQRSMIALRGTQQLLQHWDASVENGQRELLMQRGGNSTKRHRFSLMDVFYEGQNQVGDIPPESMDRTTRKIPMPFS